MRGMTWFGTRGHETWIPTPAINPEYGRTGYSSVAQGLNGDASVRQSKNAHNFYVLSWPISKSRDAVRSITDFADGVFDTQDGTNLIYWIDPMAADKNVLPQHWASPILGAEDAQELLYDEPPSATPTPVNSLRYPARSARYKMGPASEGVQLYLPIPPDSVAWVGIHGSSEAEGHVWVQPQVHGQPADTPVAPEILSVTDTVRVNTSFDGAQYDGIELYLGGAASNVQFTLSGLIVQILPRGRVPEAGGFISGQGHSGCQFVGNPGRTPYSAKLDMVGLTARLEETGAGL